jgi:ribulose-phosphate 3-epimerase
MISHKLALAPSIICADWGRLEKHLEELSQLEIDWIHYDVMDGHFVPNISMGHEIQAKIHAMTRIPIDTHLMVEEPDHCIESFVRAGSRVIAVHPEATRHVDRTLRLIASLGVTPAVAINPATPLSVLEHLLELVGKVIVMTVNPGFVGQTLVPYTIDKIARLRAMLIARGLDVDIQVDGNVSFEHIPKMVGAGATNLVLGTSSLYAKGMSIRDAHARVLEVAAR